MKCFFGTLRFGSRPTLHVRMLSWHAEHLQEAVMAQNAALYEELLR